MGPASLTIVLTVLATFVKSTLAQPRPQNVPFNTSGSHGPDGPWNYITLAMGSSPSSLVDFYPMTIPSYSVILSSHICANSPDQCISPLPAYYNPDAKSQADDSASVPQRLAPNLGENADMVGTGYYAIDEVTQPFTVDNLTFGLGTNLTSNYNTREWVPLSLLSLEPKTDNGTQFDDNTPVPGQHTVLQAYMESTGGAGIIGLHMGSARYNQSGSLYLGGFDRNRLIEPPAVIPHVGASHIDSISFGHAGGLDPWENESQKPVDNFLSNGGLDVLIKPQIATLSFPSDVCDRLSKSLPVSPDKDTGLYLWNTSAPLYHKLMSSPSYMNFTFANNSQAAIKIPFALLNLNLSAPIKNTPTPYFPCEPQSGNSFALGRAFLQGAIFIQSYDPPRVIIGQAPGPLVNSSTPADPTIIDLTNPAGQIASNPPHWADTWAAHLTPLSNSSSSTGPAAAGSDVSSSSNGPASANGGQLGGGAIAGIVIGVLIAVGLAGAAAFYLRRRSARPQKTALDSVATTQELFSGKDVQKFDSKPRPYEMNGHFELAEATANQPHEADGGFQLVEAPAGHDSSQGFISELPATSIPTDGRNTLGSR